MQGEVMDKCALCDNPKFADLLCTSCNNSRLLAASLARIISGRGLNYENAELYSEKNWVEVVLKQREEINARH
jgi:hypothetical protein